MSTENLSLKMAKTRVDTNKQKASCRQSGRQRCCNPFNKNNQPKHVGKDVRKVSKLILKMYAQILAGSMICAQCRKNAKNQELRQIRRTQILHPNATRAGKNIAPHSESDILLRNLSRETVKTREEELEEMFQALKEKFSSLDRNDPLRLQMMTCAPKDWSIAKISREFGASKRQAGKAKQLRESEGIWPDIERTSRTRIPQSNIDAAIGFYNDDTISKILPGKKDVVSVKVDGNQELIQKRLILFELIHVYQKFKVAYPELKMSQTFFNNLRPKNVVLPGASGTHVVCAVPSTKIRF